MNVMWEGFIKIFKHQYECFRHSIAVYSFNFANMKANLTKIFRRYFSLCFSSRVKNWKGNIAVLNITSESVSTCSVTFHNVF